MISSTTVSARYRSRSDRVAWNVLPGLVRVIGRVVWRLKMDLDTDSPDPPFVIASNHHSFLDPFLIGAALRRKIRFLALEDLFGNYAFVDFALAAFDIIPLQRGVVPLGPARTALTHLDQGGVVAVFPEGTRHDRFEPDTALPGAAWLATRAGVPLVPAAISGTEVVLGLENRLHRGRIHLSIGPPLHSLGTDRESIDELTRQWSDWTLHAIERHQAGMAR